MAKISIETARKIKLRNEISILHKALFSLSRVHDFTGNIHVSIMEAFYYKMPDKVIERYRNRKVPVDFFSEGTMKLYKEFLETVFVKYKAYRSNSKVKVNFDDVIAEVAPDVRSKARREGLLPEENDNNKPFPKLQKSRVIRSYQMLLEAGEISQDQMLEVSTSSARKSYNLTNRRLLKSITQLIDELVEQVKPKYEQHKTTEAEKQNVEIENFFKPKHEVMPEVKKGKAERPNLFNYEEVNAERDKQKVAVNQEQVLATAKKRLSIVNNDIEYKDEYVLEMEYYSESAETFEDRQRAYKILKDTIKQLKALKKEKAELENTIKDIEQELNNDFGMTR